VAGFGDLRGLPKVDLHVHLENTARMSTLRELANRNGMSLPAGLYGDRYRFGGFADFFAQNTTVRSCLCHRDDFQRVAYEFCEDEAAQGVRYAEVTFTVGAHAERLGDWEAPLEGVLEGLAKGEADFGIRCALVFDHSRRRPVELAWRTLEAALQHRDRVVGLGLAGDETYPAEPFAPVFEAAIDAGVHSVPHAGEAAGPESVTAALSFLRAERTGHGFRAIGSESVVVELRERRIPLELCLSSNVALGLVPSFEDHPLPALLEAGLVVTLNTDIPGMTLSPIAAEYATVRRVFGLDDAVLANLARAGVDASFAGAETKATLHAEIDAWFHDDSRSVARA
jgi:adenosine deaminase